MIDLEKKWRSLSPLLAIFPGYFMRAFQILHIMTQSECVCVSLGNKVVFLHKARKAYSDALVHQLLAQEFYIIFKKNRVTCKCGLSLTLSSEYEKLLFSCDSQLFLLFQCKLCCC